MKVTVPSIRSLMRKYKRKKIWNNRNVAAQVLIATAPSANIDRTSDQSVFRNV